MTDVRRSSAILVIGLAMALACGGSEEPPEGAEEERPRAEAESAQEAAEPEPPAQADAATAEAEEAAQEGGETAQAGADELVESGTFTLEAYRASFIGSAGYAKGVLGYQGKRYPFRVAGLGADAFVVSWDR